MNRKAVNKIHAKTVNNSPQPLINIPPTGYSPVADTSVTSSDVSGAEFGPRVPSSVKDALALGDNVAQIAREMFALGFVFGLNQAPRVRTSLPPRLSEEVEQFLHGCWDSGFAAGARRRVRGVAGVASGGVV